MSEDYQRQSALAHLGLAQTAVETRDPDHGVGLREQPFRGIVDLRGRTGDSAFMAATRRAIGFDLPTEANTVAAQAGLTALWLGPDEWWVTTAHDGADLAERLASALAGAHAAVADVGESLTVLEVTGPRAQDLLAKGCPLDLHPRVFGPGRCAQSLLAKASVCLHQLSDEPVFEIYVRRSFAEYLWRWLADAGGEYGLSVLRA